MTVIMMYDDGSVREFSGAEAKELHEASEHMPTSRRTGPLQCNETRKVRPLDRMKGVWLFSRCQLNQAHKCLHCDGEVEW